VWAVLKIFQALPVPCGASPDVTDSREKRNQGQFEQGVSQDVISPDLTDSREKRNQGQSDFLRQKIW